MKHQLKQGLASLPKPKDSDWELELPDEQQEPREDEELSEEDAELRDRRNRQIREAQEKLDFKRRTQVMQKNLPRPAVVDITAMLKNVSGISDSVEASIAEEMALLIANDATKYPTSSIKVQGKSRPLETFEDDVLAQARLQLAMEVPRDDAALADELFEKAWREVHTSPLLPGLAGYGEDEIDEHQLMTEAFDKVQDSIVTAAEKGNKLEKKLGLHLGGYQKRAKMLRQKITDAADALEKATYSLDAFRTLQVGEEAAISSRLEGLRNEVGFMSTREREAQELYRATKEELDSLVGGANGYH